MIELNIEFLNDEMKSTILQALPPLALERVVQGTLHKVGIFQPVTLALLITGDEAIRDLNRQYRQQDKPTDVLSFPLLNKPLVNAPAEQLWIQPQEHTAEKLPKFVTPSELPTALGDIVISWPTVLKQATGVGSSPTNELLYLLSHGVLHLVGYDDLTEAGYTAMVQLQQTVLEELG